MFATTLLRTARPALRRGLAAGPTAGGHQWQRFWKWTLQPRPSWKR